MSKLQEVIILLFILIQIKSASSDPLTDSQAKLQRLKKRSQQLYGNLTKQDKKSRNEWKLELEDKLLYPGGKLEKKAELSSLWHQYYDCMLYRRRRLVDKINPSEIIMVYAGAVARLTCGLCLSPEDTAIWMYAPSSNNLTFVPMEEKDTIVIERDGNVTIYHATNEEAGVYRCQVGDSVSGLVFLEIVDDEENYTVVKPLTSHGPFPAESRSISDDLIIFSSWSKWSECSRCDAVGRRRRFGICYLTAKHQLSNSPAIFDNTTTYVKYDDAINIFKEFPKGIPCRSQLLPENIKNDFQVQERPSEIMIGLCKVPCNKSVIFEVRSAAGELLERANNSAGVYSLRQTLPPQPPPPASDVMFVKPSHRVAVRCPGTTLRDIPVSWRAGTRRVVPRELDTSSGRRVFIDARDHLVITAVQYQDQNLYSCWQAGHLAGRVEVNVSRDLRRLEPRTVLLAMMLLVLFLTKALYKVYTRKLAR